MDYLGEGGLPDIRDRLPKRRGSVTLDASGNGTIQFLPPILLARDPFIQLTPSINSGEDPVIANRIRGSFVKNSAGAYVSVQIKGGRMRGNLPQIFAVSGLLTAVITGVNNIVTALTGLTLINYGTATGVVIDWQAS